MPTVEDIAGLIEKDHQTVTDLAAHVGSEIHDILKRVAMTMPTVGTAMALGVHVAAQMLCEAVRFAENSMEGDVADAVLVRSAGLIMFAELVDSAYPDQLLAACRYGIEPVDPDSPPS